MEEKLVSVTVISYNSEKTIIETLESIKNQTYKRIELIVSDDCSRDSTVSICRDWLESNEDRFERAELLTAEKNQGVCANGNKAKWATTGEWVKGIAADDILMPNCIDDFMEYVAKYPDVSFIASKMDVYNETFEESNCVLRNKGENNADIFKLTLDEQLKRMAYDSFVQAPSIFYKKEIFDKVGGYSGRYPFEDWPFYLDVLEAGYKMYYMDKTTVGYRYHTSSSNDTQKVFNYNFNIKTHQFIKERCFKYYSNKKRIATRIKWFMEEVIHAIGMDKKTRINSFLYDCVLGVCARISK